jgi:hypothetical protein
MGAKDIALVAPTVLGATTTSVDYSIGIGALDLDYTTFTWNAATALCDS